MTSDLRPNLIVVIADDHRADASRCYGDPQVRTPEIDRLAARGARFTTARCQAGMSAAICAPSRACLLTGRELFAATRSVDPLDGVGTCDIADDAPTLPELLSAAGYWTYAVGKWHNGRASHARSFDGGDALFFGRITDQWALPMWRFDPTGRYEERDAEVRRGFSTEIFTDAATKFLRDYEGDDPYFLYVAFTAPHDPRTPPKEYADLYDPDSLELTPDVMPRHPFDNGELEIRDELLAPWPRTPEIIRRHLADYYGMISHMDACIGEIVAAADQRGDPRPTYVVYTSDHGLALGRHGLLGKQNCYEHSLRIPLVMVGPAVEAGSVRHELVNHQDTFATLAALAGIEPPPGARRSSLLGPGPHGHECSYAAYKDVQRMVCDERYKLIDYHRSEARGVGEERRQLFDLEQDPFELHNLAGSDELADVEARLERQLRELQVRLGDPLAARSVTS
ncbi:MAG TPA: sulfatase-like hydrolase/transferase [Acidimicrobiales bacterium]|nr:sulfatase-like hydrolase/transferase [Acidimicrobiales bacterium]